MDVLSFLVFGTGELWLNLEGMGAEVISLGLEQVGWKILGAVTIEPRKSSRESRGWDAKKSGLGDDVAPAGLGFVDSLVKEVVEEKVLKVRIGTVGSCDILEEDGTNDATAAPHEGNGRLIKLPSVLLGSLAYY